MMKPITRIIVFNLLLFAVSSSRATPSSGALNGPLYVYGYDSFFSKGSLGVLLNQEFEKRYGMKVKAVAFASEGEALNQIVLQGKKSNADVLVGLDNSLLARAEQSKLFRKMESGTWKNRLVDGLPNDLTFIPFEVEI